MRSVSVKYPVKAVLPKGSQQKILDYLAKDNIVCEFFEGRMDAAKADGLRRKLARRWNDVRTNFSLARHLSKTDLKNSIVQIDVAPWSGFFLLLYLALKTDVFITFHTCLPEFSPFRKLLLKIKFAVLTTFKRFQMAASNLDVKNSLRPFVSESRFREMKVVYSSVNIEEINRALRENKSRAEIAERYNLPADKIWICNVAQFIERKGCWVFLEAIKILREQRDDLYFIWLGTGTLDVEAIEKIRRCQVGDDFRFFSAAEIGETRDDLLALWNASDIFALPSFQEGLPMSLVEAMALGKPCIASDINAIPEAVEHLSTGLLVDAGDAAQLACAVNNLADNKQLRKTLGENARKLVFEKFQEKVTGRQMLEFYESINSR